MAPSYLHVRIDAQWKRVDDMYLAIKDSTNSMHYHALLLVKAVYDTFCMLNALTGSSIRCDSIPLTVPMDDNDAADACTTPMPVFTFTSIIHFAPRSASSAIEIGSF